MKTVMLAGLGLCEHCGTLITMEDIPGGEMDAEWHCPSCSGVLSHKSFGYESSGDKIQWVDSDGQWTKEKPTEDFELRGWRVFAQSVVRP